MPTLAYNLLSVTKATEAGKMVTFGVIQGEIVDTEGEVVAMATKAGSLYYLNSNRLTMPLTKVARTSGTGDMVTWGEETCSS